VLRVTGVRGAALAALAKRAMPSLRELEVRLREAEDHAALDRLIDPARRPSLTRLVLHDTGSLSLPSRPCITVVRSSDRA
jgi:hypothetical protein